MVISFRIASNTNCEAADAAWIDDGQCNRVLVKQLREKRFISTHAQVFWHNSFNGEPEA